MKRLKLNDNPVLRENAVIYEYALLLQRSVNDNKSVIHSNIDFTIFFCDILPEDFTLPQPKWQYKFKKYWNKKELFLVKYSCYLLF